MALDRKQEQASFDQLPQLPVSGGWSAVLHGSEKTEFERLLPQFLMQRRWFGGKGRKISAVSIAESVPIPHDNTTSYLALLDVRYEEGTSEMYLLGLSFVISRDAASVLRSDRNAALLYVTSQDGEGIVYDAVRDRGFVMALLDSIDRETTFSSDEAEIAASRTEKFEELVAHMNDAPPRVMGAEQSNTSIVFGEKLIMKLFRRVESGLNPDLEIGRFLTEHGFFNTPPVAGAIEMSPPADDEEPRTIGILQGFVPNKGDAWKYTLEQLDTTLKKALDHKNEIAALPIPYLPLLELADQKPPALFIELAGDYLQSVRLLGQRTAELHVTLDSDDHQQAFAPEQFSPEYQRSVYNSMRRLANTVFGMLRSYVHTLAESARGEAQKLLSREQELNEAYKIVVNWVFDAERTRIHGDYHLGQVLYTGGDFVIIDFEGEPMRSISERRVKVSPLRDVAGMLRSFDYASHTGVSNSGTSGDNHDLLRRFSRVWVAWVSATFLSAYMNTAKQAPFMPSDKQETATMLDIFLLDKAVYEIGYELNNRPTWVNIPITGILQILDTRHRQLGDKRRVA